MHGTCHLLTYSERAIALVDHGFLVAEQCRGGGVSSYAGTQLAVLCHAQCQECPLVLRYTIKRGVGLVANLHY